MFIRGDVSPIAERAYKANLEGIDLFLFFLINTNRKIGGVISSPAFIIWRIYEK